jgi:hypothetical protein
MAYNNLSEIFNTHINETSSSSSSSSSTSSSSTNNEEMETFATEKGEMITVEDIIERFRKELIASEEEIGGIYESAHDFYRHFQLDFDENKSLMIRCTYSPHYESALLDISCFEYKEVGNERITSNGEIEKFTMRDYTYKSEVEVLNWTRKKQKLHMKIQ